MRIVSMSLKLASIPRPKTLALSAKHLVASLSLMNKHLAIRTWFGVLLQHGNRSNRVRIANMKSVIPRGLEFPAMRARMFVATGTLPSGRHKPIAFRISTPMYELLNIFKNVGALTNQAIFGMIQIILELLELLDLSDDVLDLCIDVVNKTVMSECSLCGRKHGLFLSEENVLLVFGEFALEESLGKSEMLNLRMSEGCVAKHTFWNRDIVSTKESLITSAASSLCTSVERAADWFAIGRIEIIETNRAGHF
jgi:hypothetical protein